MNYTRRDFGKFAMATVPAAAGLSIPGMMQAAQSSKFDGVQIGVITYSFRGAPPQGVAPAEMPATMQKIGLSEVELMSGDCESIAGIPQNPNAGRGGGFGGGRGGSGRGRGGGFGGGRNGGAGAGGAEVAMAPNGCPVNTPSGRDSAAKAAAASGAPVPAGRGGRGPGTPTPEQEAFQKSVADWKMAANASTWKGVRQKFNDAGVDVQILCYNMNINTTKDDEIEYAFQMARDLGVRAISCSTTMAMAKRVVPFANKHKIMWAAHGHFNIYDPEEFARPETFLKLISLSKYFGVNLDIGHFTQAGYDAMTFIPQIHTRITNIHLKDSMKPDKCGVAGPTQPWGQGQTPIKDVLLMMKKNKYTFPANIELEYRIPQGSDSATEVAKCLAFAKNCFA